MILNPGAQEILFKPFVFTPSNLLLVNVHIHFIFNLPKFPFTEP